MLFMLFAVLMDLNTLNLEEWGLYIPEGVVVQKLGDHYVVGGNRSDCFVVVDAQGNQLARYEQTGSGPNLLRNSFLMGVQQDRIYISKSNSQMILFDDKLQVQEDVPPRLPFHCRGGAAIGDNKFVVEGGASKFALAILELRNNEWVVQDQGFDREYDPQTDRVAFNYLYQNGLVFQLPKYKREPDSYEVNVHEVREKLEPNIIQVLGNTLDNEPKVKGNLVYQAQAYRAGDHYVVLLQIATPSFKIQKTMLDVFSLNGDFVRRQDVPLNTWLIPAVDTFEVYLPSEDETSAARLRF